ncbi:MAG: hypothetical protein R3E34_15355 [Rhodocyclaceae bacterium]
MSAAEDRFIAGDGPLAALIRAQPAIDAPPRLLEHILAALDAAPSATGFDAPAGLFDAVMAEAERIDSAQAPRREALLAELAAGKAADDALGAPVNPATAAWLAGQQPPSHPARPPRRRRWPWLAGISTALTAALAVSVALRVVQAPAPETAAMPAAAPTESAMDTLRESSAGASAEASAGATRSADNTLARSARPPLAERLAKAEALPPSPARNREMARPDAEAKRAAPRPDALAAMMADTAPARPAAPAPPAGLMQEAAPTDAPSMMAKTRRSPPAMSAPLPAEADAAMAPQRTIDAPLDTPAATLAARLQARPPTAWTLTVAAADETAGRALHAALIAKLEAAGRGDTITLTLDTRPPGHITLRPDSAAPAHR